MSLNAQQVQALLQPIKAHRVLQANGQSHVPAYDVAAHLTRILGFGGWDKEILSLTLIDEAETTTKNNKPAWAVTYACTLKLTIKDDTGSVVAFWEDGACGSAILLTKGDAHDMAMKSAISYALKRCAAFGLGDQFGLSLYNKGNTKALIGKTLVMPEGAGEATDLESHIPIPESMGNDEGEGIDHLADLAAALGASGLTQEERKVFIEDAVGHPVAKFSDLTQEEAKSAGVKLRIAMIGEATEDAGE